eukprot:1898125-Heterocapsa_arctica.AAC.1
MGVARYRTHSVPNPLCTKTSDRPGGRTAEGPGTSRTGLGSKRAGSAGRPGFACFVCWLGAGFEQGDGKNWHLVGVANERW